MTTLRLCGLLLALAPLAGPVWAAAPDAGADFRARRIALARDIEAQGVRDSAVLAALAMLVPAALGGGPTQRRAAAWAWAANGFASVVAAPLAALLALEAGWRAPLIVAALAYAAAAGLPRGLRSAA